MEDKYSFQISDEKKIEQLYQSYCKSEQNHIKFSELFVLLLEKGLVRNSYGLRFYLDAYNRAIDEEVEEEKRLQQEITTDLRQMKKIQEQQKELVQGKLNRFKFQNWLKIVGRQYFHGQKNPIDKYLEQILYEIPTHRKKSANANNLFFRVLNYDESNKRVFNDYSIYAVLDFEEDFKKLFTAYMPENYDKQHIMLTWEEIDMLNKKLSTMSMIRLLVDANIIPNVISAEHYQEVQIRIIPPFNSVEQNFYQQENIKKIVEKDIGKKPITTKIEGDPYISFFEFCMLFCKIAIDSTPKDQIKKEKDISDVIERFLQNIVQIRKNQQENDWDIMKKSTKYMNTYIYRLFCPNQQSPTKKKEDSRLTSQANIEKNNNNNGNQPKTTIMDNQTNSQSESNIKYNQKNRFDEKEEDFFDEPMKLLQAMENNAKFGEGLTSKFELDAIYKVLNNELPQIPPAYQPVKQVTNTQNYIPKVIGEQPPKPPVDKNAAKKAKEQPKKKAKKGEEEREIRWAGMPPPPPKTTYDHFTSYNDQLEFNNPYQISQKSGVMSHIEAAPVILEEMVYPQNMPIEAKKYLEASILNYSQQNFAASLENINTCYDSWLNIEDRSDLTIQNEIFFEYFKGMIFQSAGRDDLALSSFFAAKTLSDKLSIDSPDKALPYCGLGGLLFRMEEYNLSLRAYLQGRTIRETSIGADNMETATIYNNLGCCMLKLNRNLEATTYFEIAEAIFDLELGQFHIRTSTVSRNLVKCKKQGICFLPEFRTPWIAYEKDPLKKKKPTGKDDKKKK